MYGIDHISSEKIMHYTLNKVSSNLAKLQADTGFENAIKMVVVGGGSVQKALSDKILNQTVIMPISESPKFKSLAELDDIMRCCRFSELYIPTPIKNDVAYIKVNATNYIKLKEAAILDNQPKFVWHEHLQVLVVDNTLVLIDDDMSDNESCVYYYKEGKDKEVTKKPLISNNQRSVELSKILSYELPLDCRRFNFLREYDNRGTVHPCYK